METKIVKARALAASERIRLALAQIESGDGASRVSVPNAAALGLCARSLGEAGRDIDALLAELETGDQPLPALRTCPACGKSIRAQATRCGFCWTKQ